MADSDVNGSTAQRPRDDFLDAPNNLATSAITSTLTGLERQSSLTNEDPTYSGFKTDWPSNDTRNTVGSDTCEDPTNTESTISLDPPPSYDDVT